MFREGGIAVAIILVVTSKVNAVVQEKTIVFAIGGLSSNALSDANFTGIRRVVVSGVCAPFVEPVYPSLLYPNLYSLVTGLYAENHGFVGDTMYDIASGQFFEPASGNAKDEVHWWNNAEPLWITAERMSLKTFLYWWPGCEVRISNRHPSACESYRSGINSTHLGEQMLERIDDVLEMFQSDDLNLAMFYFGEVAENSLQFGPHSHEAKTSLRKVDNIIQRLYSQMDKKELSSKVNFIIVSDSGIASVDHDKVHHIDLDELSSHIKYQISYGALSMILPEPGMEDMVHLMLANLSTNGFHIYKKDKIPLNYHVAHSDRTLPILLQAEPGFLINPINDSAKVRGINFSSHKGIQGYDPSVVPEMKTVFCGSGPVFRKNLRMPQLHNVDLYNVLIHATGLKPLPNNGSWENVKEMFAEKQVPSVKSETITTKLSYCWTLFLILLPLLIMQL